MRPSRRSTRGKGSLHRQPFRRLRRPLRLRPSPRAQQGRPPRAMHPPFKRRRGARQRLQPIACWRVLRRRPDRRSRCCRRTAQSSGVSPAIWLNTRPTADRPGAPRGRSAPSPQVPRRAHRSAGSQGAEGWWCARPTASTGPGSHSPKPSTSSPWGRSVHKPPPLLRPTGGSLRRPTAARYLAR